MYNNYIFTNIHAFRVYAKYRMSKCASHIIGRKMPL